MLSDRILRLTIIWLVIICYGTVFISLFIKRLLNLSYFILICKNNDVLCSVLATISSALQESLNYFHGSSNLQNIWLLTIALLHTFRVLVSYEIVIILATSKNIKFLIFKIPNNPFTLDSVRGNHATSNPAHTIA